MYIVYLWEVDAYMYVWAWSLLQPVCKKPKNVFVYLFIIYSLIIIIFFFFWGGGGGEKEITSVCNNLSKLTTYPN